MAVTPVVPDYSLLEETESISPEQARNLAELITIYTNIAPQAGGVHRLDEVATYIQRNGLQKTIDTLMKTPGTGFEVNLLTPTTPRETAIALVDRLYKDADIAPQNATYYQNWVTLATKKTPQELIEQWNKQQLEGAKTKPAMAKQVSKITPEELEGFTKSAEEARQTLMQNDINNFIQSANKIYKGFDLTPNYGPDANAEEVIKNRLQQFNYNANEKDIASWTQKAQRYGLGTAIADLDRDLALRGFDLNLSGGSPDETFKNILLPGQLPSTYIGSPLYQERNYAQTPVVQPGAPAGPSAPTGSIVPSTMPAPSNVLVPSTAMPGSSNIPIQGVPQPTLPQTTAPTNIPIQGVPTPQIPSTSSFINTALGGQSNLPSLEAATPVTQGPRPTEQPMPQPMPTPSIFSSLPAPQPLVGTVGLQPLVPQPQIPVQQAPQPQMTNEEFIQQQQAPVQMADGGSVGGASSGVRRLKMSGYQDGGDVSNDKYIQEMMTGTPPENMEAEPGLLPPELRKGVDVPLDLLNTILRGTAGAVGGPAYGLYKGVTSDKFGTKEGVKEARSEAERMMAEISGEPKTEEVRNLMEKLGQLAEEAKIPPMPQYLTTPAPGPGSASALMRSYELAETPPVGAVKLADKGAKPVATPPTDALGFYSPTEQVVMNLSQDKGTASQMLAQITKAPGVKPVELRATGLDEFLKGKGNEPVTKQEIQDFLTSNRVEVDEVKLGRGLSMSPETKRLMGDAEKRMMEADSRMAPFFEQQEAGSLLQGQEPYSTFYRIRGPLSRKIAGGDQEALAELDALNLPPDIRQAVLDFGAAKAEYNKYSKQARRIEKPKFDGYNIPGGQNAREIYLTLPGVKEGVISKAETARLDELAQKRIGSSLDGLSPAEQSEYFSLIGKREKAGAAFTAPGAHAVSPEADTNRLAHIFLDDRTDAEGKKVLFVQELQSDWGQQGRDQGFAKTFTPDQLKAEEVLPKPPGPPVWRVTYPDGDQNTFAARSANEAIESAIQRESRVGLPTAPFVTNTEDWLNLALKRVIKEAVDSGADNVAFIKGEQAAEKYSLSTVLDGIEVRPEGTKGNTSRLVELKRKEGGILPLYVNENGVVETVAPDTPKEFKGKPLSEIIGKEMSEKVMSAKRKPRERESINFEVEDLVVGGEGMKGFYDNILPKTAEKLLKKLGGGKVEPIAMKKRDTGGMSGYEAMDRVGIPEDQQEMHWIRLTQEERDNLIERARNTSPTYLGFKITPEMREMVKTQGLPKFAAGGEVTDFIKRAA